MARAQRQNETVLIEIVDRVMIIIRKLEFAGEIWIELEMVDGFRCMGVSKQLWAGFERRLRGEPALNPRIS